MIHRYLTTGLLLLAAHGATQPPPSRAAKPGGAAELCWDRDVLPILRRSCLGCHGPGSAMGSLATYDSARAKADKIHRNVATRKMPMRGELGDGPRTALITWATEGAPTCP